MNKKLVMVVYTVILIFILTVTGCIAPPIELPLNTTPVTSVNHDSGPVVTTTATPVYVTIETPYVTPGSTPSPTTAYYRPPPVTPFPDDYVIIYAIKSQPFAYNKKAVSFNLKNPPMLIDFSLSVSNVTRNISADSRILTNEWTSYVVDNYAPNAFFEVTVREKATGNIVLQDGFGQSKQYGTENPRHLKVLSTGDYLIEMDGNKVAASVNISVKRAGNIDDITS